MLPVLMIGGAPSNPYLNGLVAHWTMDETTGDRVDVHNGFALVPTGTVGYTTGKIGNCLTAATDGRLSATSNDLLAYDWNALTVTAWVYIPTAYVEVGCITKGVDWFFYFENDLLYFSVAGEPADSSVISYATTLAVDTWHFIAARFDNSGLRKAQVKLNNGAWQTSAIGLTGANVVKNTINYIRINRTNQAKYGTWNYDSVSIWNRALSDDEVEGIRNEGNGLDYPFL